MINMPNMTFAQLCGEYDAVLEEITRLVNLPEQYRREDHPYVLHQQLESKAALKAEMKRRAREGK